MRKRIQKTFTLPSRTKQSFKEECDINNILRQYSKTGVVTHTSSRKPQYGNFSEVMDYQTAYNAVLDAQEQFAELPAKIREEFDHNPQKLLEAIHNPDKHDRLIKLGILERKEVPNRESPLAPEANASKNDNATQKKPAQKADDQSTS